MRIKSVLALCFLFSVSLCFVNAQESVTIKSLTGKVEIQIPGKTWEPAQKDATLTSGTLISTGFNSKAELDLGTATIFIKPLTRLSVDELVKKDNQVTTKVGLKIGRIRAQVQTSEGLKQDFEVKSPISTAAVRGTDFFFDSQHLIVFHGTVAFSNQNSLARLVTKGESSIISSSSDPTSGEAALAQAAGTKVTTTEGSSDVIKPQGNKSSGSIKVSFQ